MRTYLVHFTDSRAYRIRIEAKSTEGVDHIFTAKLDDNTLYDDAEIIGETFGIYDISDITDGGGSTVLTPPEEDR